MILPAEPLGPILLGNTKRWSEDRTDSKLHRKMVHTNEKPKGRALAVIRGSREGTGRVKIFPREHQEPKAA